MKKGIKIVAVLLAIAIVLGAGGYLGNMLGCFEKGNNSMYSVKNSQKVESSLNGKTIIFLGSSVTYGYASKGESFVDYLAKQDGVNAIKVAKSGTTLVDDKKTSYISRMKKIDKDIKVDAFLCQLSTNDATKNKPLGNISESRDLNDFDTHTIIGAMEYIIAYAYSTWGCPVLFYTGTKYDSENYQAMVDALLELKEKWDIGVIDLWNNEALNDVSAEDYDLYMCDKIHPTKVGYREWWLPIIREGLQQAIDEK